VSQPPSAFELIVPNLLTFSRIGMALAFPLVDPSWWPVILVLAAASDAFDGAFSRLFHATSMFGQVLDPIADKLLVGVVLLALLDGGIVSVPALLLVAARDLAVLSGVSLALIRRGWYTARSAPIGLLALTGAVSVMAGIDYLRHPHWSKPEGAAQHVATDDATAEL
jgi:phosphatidylserine synthase